MARKPNYSFERQERERAEEEQVLEDVRGGEDTVDSRSSQGGDEPVQEVGA